MGAWVNNGPTVFQNIVFFSPQQLSSQTIPEDSGSKQFHWNAMQCNAEHRTGISLFLLSFFISHHHALAWWHCPFDCNCKTQDAIGHPSCALFFLSLVNPLPLDDIIRWISTTTLADYSQFFFRNFFFPFLQLIHSTCWFFFIFFPPKFKYPKILKTIFCWDLWFFAII